MSRRWPSRVTRTGTPIKEVSAKISPSCFSSGGSSPLSRNRSENRTAISSQTGFIGQAIKPHFTMPERAFRASERFRSSERSTEKASSAETVGGRKTSNPCAWKNLLKSWVNWSSPAKSKRILVSHASCVFCPVCGINQRHRLAKVKALLLRGQFVCLPANFRSQLAPRCSVGIT